jgi:hypothetical protein
VPLVLVDEQMKVANNKPKRRMMHRRQSSSLRAKIIIAIFALVIFFIATRTIGSVPQEKGGRLFLRGGSSNKSINNNLVWVHSDSQPFVSGKCCAVSYHFAYPHRLGMFHVFNNFFFLLLSITMKQIDNLHTHTNITNLTRQIIHKLIIE